MPKTRLTPEEAIKQMDAAYAKFQRDMAALMRDARVFARKKAQEEDTAERAKVAHLLDEI